MLLRFTDQAGTVQRKAGRGPSWDRNDATLYFGDQIVKRFRRASPNQELLLEAFEEQRVSRKRIDDPLRRARGIKPKQRLRDTIRWLNRDHEVNLLLFCSDGTGEGARWRAVAGSVFAPGALAGNGLAISAETAKRMRVAA